jgi:hypothetical protein
MPDDTCAIGVIMLTVGAISILLYINYINSIKYFTLLDDILITRQTFSKQKKYSLKEVSSWTENHYSLFGYKTGKEIVIKTKSGTKIYLFQKNSKDFGNLSHYLNTNLSDIYKKSL